MKTINDITTEQGISRQTLYNALKKAGINIDNITTAKRGKTRLFDAEAEKKLVNLCKKNDKKEASLTEEISDLRRKLAEAEKKLVDAEKQIAEKEKEIEYRKEENRNLLQINFTYAKIVQQNADIEQKLIANYHEKEKILIANYQRETENALKTASSNAPDGAEDHRPGWIRRMLQRITGKGKREE